MCGENNCFLTVVKISSLLLMILGAAIIALSSVTMLDDNHVKAGIPGLVIGLIVVLEGVFGLMFTFNRQNRRRKITAHVFSIVTIVLLPIWMFGFFIYWGLNSSSISDTSCEIGCTTSYTYITGGFTPLILGLVGIVLSILLLIRSAPCACCGDNMDSTDQPHIVFTKS
ncbi:uncharacterized protein [Antedon mediterranea]|uniref:uncharacterized protein n=1 Tax=Antedon mediterranea TaxID=105859 RepID=UPI003AF5F447